MKHPGPPLLVDYVDGTLGDDMRAKVDAHLAACDTCRAEVRAARSGKASAEALGKPAVPAGLAEAAIAEAGRVAGARHPEVEVMPEGARRRPNAPRWAGLATAAAVVIAIALLAPKLGEPSSNRSEAAAPAAASAAPTMAVPAEDVPRASAVALSHADYTRDQLAGYAQDAKQSFDAASTSEGGVDAAASVMQPEATYALSTRRFEPATRCLEQAFGDRPQGRLVRLIYARFDGQPAYFGVYLVSPGKGLPSDELRIDVASANGCQILIQSSAKL